MTVALASQPLSEQWKYAQALAQAGLLPKAYRDSPGDVLLAMSYADSLRIPVAQVFTSIHVIDGKPSMAAELMGALILGAGHKLRQSGDNDSATCQIIRRDDPDFTYTVTYTIDDARRAGLLGKAVWKAYPRDMLRARALSGCARAACPDVLHGISYVPEELDYVDGRVIPPPPELERRQVAQEADAPAVAEVAPPSDPAPSESVPAKRRRRTKAEMEAARSETTVNLPEPDLAGPSDPAGEERQVAEVVEAATDPWEEQWLIDLELAIEGRDLAAIGVLGSKAATGNRQDLVTMARVAWNDVHGQSA